jgi:hypothetical protein
MHGNLEGWLHHDTIAKAGAQRLTQVNPSGRDALKVARVKENSNRPHEPDMIAIRPASISFG